MLDTVRVGVGCPVCWGDLWPASRLPPSPPPAPLAADFHTEQLIEFKVVWFGLVTAVTSFPRLFYFRWVSVLRINFF